MTDMFVATKKIKIIPSSLFNQTIIDNINDRNCDSMFARSGVITI